MDYDITYSFKVTCRVAIQICVGRLPSGRESHRTFSMKGIRPDASVEAIAEIIRALAPLLAYPITKVCKIVTAIKTMTFHKKEEEAAVRLAPKLAALLILFVLLYGDVRRIYRLPAAFLAAVLAFAAFVPQSPGFARSPPREAVALLASKYPGGHHPFFRLSRSLSIPKSVKRS